MWVMGVSNDKSTHSYVHGAIHFVFFSLTSYSESSFIACHSSTTDYSTDKRDQTFWFFCDVNKESKCFWVATDCCSDRRIWSLLFMLTELHSTALFKRKKTLMGLLKQHCWLWFFVWYRCSNCNQTNEINFCFIEQTLHLCKPLCYINVKLNSVESNKTFFT